MKLTIRSSRVVCLAVCAAAGSLALNVIAQDATTPACRTYSAEEVRTLSGAGHGTINQTCRFDTGRFERICTIRSQATGVRRDSDVR